MSSHSSFERGIERIRSSDIAYMLQSAGMKLTTRRITSPISMRQFCKYYGLKYKKTPLHKNTCGMMVRSIRGNYIFVNSDHSYTRRRFSVAHEAGHYFLGHESDITHEHDQHRYEEAQANKFASLLLMPDDLFLAIHSEMHTIRDMASWLRVSPISVAIRCQQFGIRRQEAESVRSEYFDFVAESAATYEGKKPTTPIPQKKIEDAPPKKSNLMTDERILNSPWYRERSSYNDKMIDRYRRMYGYE